MRTYKLYSNATATTNNAANVTLAKSGRIKGVRFIQCMNTVVDNEEITFELSLFPTSMIGTNDAAGVIAETQLLNNGTSGGVNGVFAQHQVDIPVGLGEKLYLNCVVVGTPSSAKCTCFVDIEE